MSLEIFLRGRGDEVVSTLFLKSMCPFTSSKFPFIPRTGLLFSKIALLFSRSDLFFPRSVFLFPGIVLLFSIIALYFSRCTFFLFTVCSFFPEYLFSSWLYLLLILLSAAQRVNIYLVLLHMKYDFLRILFKF